MSTSTGVWQKALVYLGLWEESADPYLDDQHEDEVIDLADGEQTSSNVRPLRLAPVPGVGERATDTRSRPRTAVVEVSAFEDCEQIGMHFRDGSPVLFDLAGVDRTVARRVIDFVSGMTFARHGVLEKVASRAFVLAPEGTPLSDEERLRLEARGYRFADGA